MARTVDPILSGIDRTEVISDPALRELYFGSTDTPGLINQATRAAQKAYLDQPAILQETAGLTAQEQQARQLAQQGIGSYQPFLRQAEQAYGSGLGSLQASLGFGGPSARQLLGQSLRGYDPRMAGQFYNPFEQQVVDQTIQDVLKAGEMQDIQQRASDISRGGESAFGSRARLTAQERQESLGRGLGDVLSKIRSGGFNTAQERALQELQNQRSAAQRGAQLEAGFGEQLSGAQRLFGSDITSLGEAGQRLRGLDVAQLENLGATERGIEQQRLNNQYAQQLEQRQSPLLAAQFVQGFAPQYQASRTQVGKTYGMPVDPLSQGLGAALSAYQALKPPMQYQQPQYNPPQSNQPAQTSGNNRAYFSPDIYNPQSSLYQSPNIDTSTPAGQQQILAGGQFAGQMGPPNPINLPNTLPAQTYGPYGIGQAPTFNPANPGANLPYNPFGPRS